MKKVAVLVSIILGKTLFNNDLIRNNKRNVAYNSYNLNSTTSKYSNIKKSIKIMLYGDSLMAGYGLSENENLASELTRNFEGNNISVSIINASISGNTSKYIDYIIN